jgi:hypothetical protein
MHERDNVAALLRPCRQWLLRVIDAWISIEPCQTWSDMIQSNHLAAPHSETADRRRSAGVYVVQILRLVHLIIRS